MASEAELVAAAQHDPAAFGVLYDQHVDQIYRYLLARSGDVATAEDLTAETFLAALQSLWRYRWTGKPFSAWLYRIARSRLGEHYRKLRRLPTVSLELAAELPDLRAGEAGLFPLEDRAVAAALGQLREVERDVVVLRYFQDLPLAEIAWVLNLPLNTVKSHLRRSLERLRRILDDHGAVQQPQPRRALAPRGAER